jgi:hypothetical protein
MALVELNSEVLPATFLLMSKPEEFAIGGRPTGVGNMPAFRQSGRWRDQAMIG